ncbi:hypothetical protein KIN20_015000 [Parelaphostrongylus tenuis]|uniref:Uncharacterized protein n=1 Tax=Parelaphostrongylus tenuis TaxID=148309 RepID=A0AAD5MIV7_PARTN|nr:hypothetical protein KIN20_015000 [Parelaphostrongylus tenuis]
MTNSHVIRRDNSCAPRKWDLDQLRRALWRASRPSVGALGHFRSDSVILVESIFAGIPRQPIFGRAQTPLSHIRPTFERAQRSQMSLILIPHSVWIQGFWGAGGTKQKASMVPNCIDTSVLFSLSRNSDISRIVTDQTAKKGYFSELPTQSR